ncbi:MAG TPA: hypothetical protein VJ453_02760 [Terriglobales bacterium]|jgi:DNA uptake protein ComE-like DNA-binding protein|nr:hypothetical protein [Terriglobales bacterium]
MKSFVVGLGAGFAIGALVAPLSGSDTRQKLVTDIGKLGGLTREQVDRLRGEPKKVLRRAKQRANSLAEQVTDAAADAMEQVREAAQSLASKAGVGPLVLLNTASRDKLLSIYGIGPVLADKIIAGRPYAAVRDIVTRGIIPESILNEVSRSAKSA